MKKCSNYYFTISKRLVLDNDIIEYSTIYVESVESVEIDIKNTAEEC